MSDYQPTPPQSTPYTGAPVAPRSQTLSILSMVFGILGALSGWFFVGALPAIAGVVLGFIARRREPQARGFWLTGIITGFVGLLGLVAVIAFYIIIFAIAGANGGFDTAP